MAIERLQKILARAGLGSRRACEELILQGRVQVDGQTVTAMGSRADPEKQSIVVDGEPVRVERPVHYLLYKPRGFICSTRPEGGRPPAIALVNDPRRLFTVGRLDEDSEGLIIVTNDGALTQRLTHPSFGVPKEYAVTVDGPVDHRAVARMRSGVYLAEGRTAPAEVRLVSQGHRAQLTVCIREGLNRQVRRMFAAVGLNVRRLVRVRIGQLQVGELAPGRFRRLSDAEVRALLVAPAHEPEAAPAADAPVPDRHPRPPESRRPFAKSERFRGRGGREDREDRGDRGHRQDDRRDDRRGSGDQQRSDRPRVHGEHRQERDARPDRGRKGERHRPERSDGPRDRGGRGDFRASGQPQRRDDRRGPGNRQRSDRPRAHREHRQERDARPDRGRKGERHRPERSGGQRDRGGHGDFRGSGQPRRRDDRRGPGDRQRSDRPRAYGEHRRERDARPDFDRRGDRGADRGDDRRPGDRPHGAQHGRGEPGGQTRTDRPRWYDQRRGRRGPGGREGGREGGHNRGRDGGRRGHGKQRR